MPLEDQIYVVRVVKNDLMIFLAWRELSKSLFSLPLYVVMCALHLNVWPTLLLLRTVATAKNTSRTNMVLSFILIQNRQGKTRLAKWYAPYTDEEKVKLKGEV